MIKRIVTVTPESSVVEAARKMRGHSIGCVVVIGKKNNKKLVGIVSERDITTKLVACGRDPDHTPVKEVMSTKLFTAHVNDSLAKVASLMHKRHIRHIPVVDSEYNILGILSMRDLLSRIEANLRHLVKETTKDLNIDALTGLYNYRFFNNYMDAEIARSSRHGHHLSLLFIDIDHFKIFNDTYGHAKGDRLLKEIAKLLKNKEDFCPRSRCSEPSDSFSIRKSDISARIGGDEFILILPETSKEGALFCAERLRQAVEQTDFLGREHQPARHVTISIGIAEFPLDAINKKDLVDKADQALYQAKKLGRNRVYVYT